MKKQSLVLIAAAIMISAASLAVQAQASSAELVAKIPFQFRVGNRALPAGTYRVACIRPSGDACVLRLRSEDGRAIHLVQTINTTGSLRDDARLVFRRYGHTYHFSEAWFASDPIGYAAPKSRWEKADEKLAAAKPRTETVTLR